MANQRETAMNSTTPVASVGGAPAPVSHSAATYLWSTIRRFVKEVISELQKTTWPSQNELTKFTVVVLVTIFCVAVFLYLAHLVVQQFSTWAFKL